MASISAENAKDKNDRNDAILKALAKTIKEKTSKNLFNKEYFHQFLNTVNEKTISLMDVLSPFYDIAIDPRENQVLPNEKVIGEWIKNNNHSYFARVRYKKPEIETSTATTSTPLARGAVSLEENGKIVEDKKTNTERTIMGFIPVGMDDSADEKNSRIREIRLIPKKEMRILDSILIHIVILNSQERIALFTSIEACPLIDWERYSGPKCTSWKIHEIKSAMKPEDISFELDSIFETMKIVSIALIKSKATDQENNIKYD